MREINIVLFEQVLGLTVAVYRALKIKGQGILILGLGGSGRATVCKLVAFMLQYHWLALDGAKDGSKEELKNLLRQAGGKNLRTVFYVNENQIGKESFMEDLTCIMKNGAVPNLLLQEEMDEIFLEISGSLA